MIKMMVDTKTGWLLVGCFVGLLFLGSCKKHFYLRGNYQPKEFLAQSRWKDTLATKYKPDLKYIDSLKTIRKPVDVKIAVGTWCGDSEKWVPRFFKVMGNFPVNSIHLVAVDTSKKDSAGWTKEAKIDSLPTFVFYRSGKEIGRIVEKPKKKKLEKHLYSILRE
jgi:hypothetical protein